ncbi:MAG: GWxTD domain-containing protein [Gemmatimonadota bacterium]|nr:GWxTD domain-containing protein [Gemmatimonadota bacterium]
MQKLRQWLRDHARHLTDRSAVGMGIRVVTPLRPLVTGLLGAVAVVPVAAQSPAQRDSIERFREEIVAISDSVVLLGMETNLIEVARVDRDNAFLHTRLGFLALRLGELTGEKSHYDDAGGEFEWAAELEPEWPYPWYGLGLAELAMGESSVIPFENIRQALGRDYLSKAVSAFASAAAADPTFAEGVVQLAATASAQRIRPRLDVALNAVRLAATTSAAEVAGVQLARGRLERVTGSGDSAVAAFHRYLAVGGDSGVGFFEIARSLYFVGRPRDGQQAYYRGAALSRSNAATALYREDLSWVATPEELTAFDSVAVAGREDWIGTFWRKRDVKDVRVSGERLTEHHRRYFHALSHFSLMSRHRQYNVIHPYRTDQRVFDDRGIIYVRHGEPDERAYFPASGVNLNESWLYQRSDENLIFHFVADDIQDYKLVESLADVLGAGAAVQLQTGAPGAPEASDLFSSRGMLDPVYQRLGTFSQTARAGILSEERRSGKRAVQVGTTTDAYPLRFERDLGGVVRRHLVSDATGRGGQALLVFAVPGPTMVPEASSEGVTYRVGLRVAVTSPAGDAVLYLDTTRAITRQGVFGDDDHMTGFLALPLPTGEHIVRVVLDQSGGRVGQLMEDTILVPDFATAFEMSDLIVGRVGSGLTWVSGRDSVNLSPTARFSPTDTLHVYYELHGLAEGDGYRSRLEVKKDGGGSIFGFFKRLFGGGGPPISLRFNGVASGPTTRILQTVDIGALEPGRYQIRVIIEDPQENGRLERETTVEVGGT